MQKVTITLSGSDYAALAKLKQVLSKKHPHIKVEKANLETVPGAIATLSILGITIMVIPDAISQTVSEWLYDALKKSAPEAQIEVHINSKRVSSREEIQVVLEKGSAARKKSSGK